MTSGSIVHRGVKRVMVKPSNGETETVGLFGLAQCCYSYHYRCIQRNFRVLKKSRRMLSSIPVLIVVALASLSAAQEWSKCSQNGGSCPNRLITGEEDLSDAICNFLYAPGRLPDLEQVTGDDKYALTELNKLCTRSASLCCNIPEYNCSDSAATIGQNVCELEKFHGFCTSDQNNAAQGCSATCGLCLYKGPPGCEDKDRKDCESLSDFCDKPQFSVFLQETCPWTCGKCPGTRNLAEMMMRL